MYQTAVECQDGILKAELRHDIAQGARLWQFNLSLALSLGRQPLPKDRMQSEPDAHIG